jgi:ClpP class serine protease
LTEKVKRAAAAFENKKVELAKQHELTRDGFIKNITTVNDIIENELVTSLKDELVWLRDFAKGLELVSLIPTLYLVTFPLL